MHLEFDTPDAKTIAFMFRSNPDEKARATMPVPITLDELYETRLKVFDVMKKLHRVPKKLN
jgi:hypothetical protein